MKLERLHIVLIVVVALVLRIIGLSSIDLRHDGAINAVRAYGWFDFLDAQLQTSPIIWFKHIPLWANLSFHDHPPLVFAIQNVFLRLFNPSVFSALLPFVLSGVIIALFMYLIVSKYYSKSIAFVMALIFSISSYSIWIARSGYLEAVASVFTVIVVYYLIKIKNNESTASIYYLAVFCALALLSKYTTLFILPVVLIFIILKKRPLLSSRHLYLSIILGLVILLPIIIYNTNLFLTRGHFDAALSSMVGMHPEDYAAISSRGVNANIFGNIIAIFKSLYSSMSIGFFIMLMVSVILSIWNLIKRRLNDLELISMLSIIFIFLMFIFATPAPRFLFIVFPFLLFLSAPIFKYKNKFIVLLLVIVFSFEITYSINTNYIKKPFGPAGIMYSKNHFVDDGFNALERYLLSEGALKKIERPERPNTLDELLVYDFKDKDVILIDETSDWFSRNWHLFRYFLYNNSPVIQFRDLINALPSKDMTIIEFLNSLGATGAWVVFSESGDDKEWQEYIDLMDEFEIALQKLDINPSKTIYNSLGQKSFKVYRLTWD